jgi:hypothetical protein
MTISSCEFSLFRTQYEMKGMTIVASINENVPDYTLGDEYCLHRVLGNLLSNAIKFSDAESTIYLRISYEEKKMRKYIRYSVKDEGVGMSEAEQRSLFPAVFTQTGGVEVVQKGGYGLGLTICKTMLALLGGELGCVSKQRMGDDRSSGGSEFYFSIEHKPVVIADSRSASTSSISGDDSTTMEDVDSDVGSDVGSDASRAAKAWAIQQSLCSVLESRGSSRLNSPRADFSDDDDEGDNHEDDRACSNSRSSSSNVVVEAIDVSREGLSVFGIEVDEKIKISNNNSVVISCTTISNHKHPAIPRLSLTSVCNASSGNNTSNTNHEIPPEAKSSYRILICDGNSIIV